MKKPGKYFWNRLERHGSAVAFWENERSISFLELAEFADEQAQLIGDCLNPTVDRPLVLIEAVNSIDSVAAYLGCLRAGWPVILAASGQGAENGFLVQTYKPNAVVSFSDCRTSIVTGDQEPAILHPELAVLLSTSGTTGSTKLVRLSNENVEANSQAISQYLSVRPDDVTMSTLPWHYSYGMSVLHIHMLAGASMALTSTGPIDQAFWDFAEKVGVSSLAFVPTQFELLEKVGFSESWLPRLRYITQAGGRFDPAMAESFAKRAQAHKWNLFIMYGQTEAGPRISFLPPEKALECFDTIGQPIPGGQLHLEDAEGNKITEFNRPGELIYTGPNVMMGYASVRQELGDPAGSDILRTGDIAEHTKSGYFRIVGRASRLGPVDKQDFHLF